MVWMRLTTRLRSWKVPFTAADNVQAASGEYRPQLRLVRGIEKQIRNIQREVDEIEKTASRMRDESQAAERAKLETKAAALKAEIAHLETEIPESWAGVNKEFLTLTKAENGARTKYRRAADEAWEAPLSVLAVLDANEAFAALEQDLRNMKATIMSTPEDEAQELVNELSKVFGKVEGADDVKKALGKARKALKSKTPDREKALEAYDDAVAAYEAQLAWRAEADAKLRSGLNTYLDGIRDTLGIRQQARFTRDQALEMASCTAYHRDISLNF